MLCRRALDAHADNRSVGLRMPDSTLPPDTGEAHLHECLNRLASFGSTAARIPGTGQL